MPLASFAGGGVSIHSAMQFAALLPVPGLQPFVATSPSHAAAAGPATTSVTSTAVAAA
jgi:hypothetical protein